MYYKNPNNVNPLYLSPLLLQKNKPNQAGSFSSQTSGINGDVQDGRRGSDVLSPGGRKGVRPPGVHRTCPQCSGRGRVAGDAVELVSLVPYSDPRLKPRYTKTLIAVSAVLTLMAAASLCFVLCTLSTL